MSTSLLYHAFGVRGYTYAGTEFREGRTVFRIEQPRKTLRCPECGGVALVERQGLRYSSSNRKCSGYMPKAVQNER